MRIGFLISVLLISSSLFAQDPMVAIRCSAIGYDEPVLNVFVNEQEQTWVGTSRGLYRVYDANLGEKVNLKGDQQSLLQFPDGNYDIQWSKARMEQELGGEYKISAAFYDEGSDILWIGTKEAGLFKLNTKPSLNLLENQHNGNSKLVSNEIQKILKGPAGRLWVGTPEGVLVGEGKKWKLMEKYMNIEDMAVRKGEVWVLSDGELFIVDDKDDWYTYDIDAEMTEGRIRDFTFDPNGIMWVASQVVARYDTRAETFQVFGPAEYFTSEYATQIAMAPDNKIWVGTEDKGIYLIEKESAMTVSLLVDKPISCAGNQQDAALKVRVVGGVPPYRYKWSADLQGDNPKNLSPGDYMLTVSDISGKEETTSINIPDPGFRLSITMDKAESPEGGEDASATARVEGGSPPFSFRWDNGETTAQATRLSQGEHQVTVTDGSNCEEIATITITRSLGELSLSIEQTAKIACAGNAQAALKALPAGGKPPYQYNWSNTAASGEKPSGLIAGDYALTVTDALGNTRMASLTIEQPEALIVALRVEAPASTNQADGEALASPRGGTPPYTFAWDNGETTEKAVKLAPGSHSITITDANGCTTSETIDISEDILPLSVALIPGEPIACAGEASASLTANAQGGKPPYEYNWSVQEANDEEVEKLNAGRYGLTITDAEGTTAEASIEVEEPEPIELSVQQETPAATNQANGEARVKAKGGKAPYTYVWDNGETTEKAVQLAPGQRSVTVTDANGCSATANVEVSENILPLSVSIEPTAEIKCAGEASAALKASVKGGKGPFQYAWSEADLNGEQVDKLAAGTYALTVTDAEGTTISESVEIEEPEPIELSVQQETPAATNQANGEARVKAKGGKAPYTFAWDNGETTEKAVQLAPGQRSVTVTDANGCSATANVEVSENILPLSVSIEPTAEIKCAGEASAALKASVKGGKGPFQYAWSEADLNGEQVDKLAAGTYALTVTDAEGTTISESVEIEEPEPIELSVQQETPAATNQANGEARVKAKGGKAPYTFAWDNGETTEKAVQLAPGQRSVTVTDANSCSATANVEISENILPLSVSIEPTAEIKCAGEASAALKASVKGGKGPFQYAWSEADLNGEQVNNLAAGTYALTVTDAEGTTISESVEIEEPEPIELSVQQETPAATNQANGEARVKAKGGKAPYTFAWDNGETNEKAVQLAPGQRSVTVTDANGCSATASVEISENILPLSVSIEPTAEIKCAGEASAALQATVKGGKGPFQYAWNIAEASGEKIESLSAGTYSLTVTDAEGSTAVTEAEISEPNTLSLKIRQDAPSTIYYAEGKATALVSGGTPPYQFIWDNDENTEQAIQLNPGSHSVTVTDANGCSTNSSFEITENILPLALKLDVSANILCAGDSKGAIQATVEGGKPPFSYNWVPETISGEKPNQLIAGKYALTVVDASGQEASAEIVIEEPTPLELTLDNIRPATNESTADGKATALVNGGAEPYSFQWSNNETTAEATGLPVGIHTITVTDANGCQESAQAEIKKRILPELTASQLQEGQTIRMQTLQFEADSFRVNEVSIPVINEVAQFLKDNANIVVEIGGHTNGIPEHDYCDWLSTERAKAIAEFIVQKKGIEGKRVYYQGYGKRSPIATNRTEEGRRLNQRVEVKILSVKGILDNN
jgi:outer membrane protein OmpA-like peptidoglycan-associated protein